jgi:hypothetical protein
MPTIEFIVRDDEGHILDNRLVNRYTLDWGKQSFHEIEGAVEQFKKNMLPDLEVDLLKAAQCAFIKDKKRVSL